MEENLRQRRAARVGRLDQKPIVQQRKHAAKASAQPTRLQATQRSSCSEDTSCGDAGSSASQASGGSIPSSRRHRARTCRKDDRAITADEGTTVNMGVDGPRQNLCLHIAPEGNVILRALRVGHANDVLLDDRAFIEVGSDIMRGRPNELHPALIGLAVGIGTLKARQEGVVDIDDPPCHVPAEAIGENLHIASQNDELRVPLCHDLAQLGFGLILRGGGYRDIEEGMSWFTTTF